MIDFTRKQQYFHLDNRINKVNVGWLARLEILHELVSSCERVDEKSPDSFFKSLEIFKKLEGPQLISEYKLLTNDKFEMKLNIHITLLASKFDNLTNVLKYETRRWSVNFVDNYEDLLSSFLELNPNFQAMKVEMFLLRVNKNNVTIPPLKEYTKEWLKSLLK
jgi:hypothetical protein